MQRFVPRRRSSWKGFCSAQQNFGLHDSLHPCGTYKWYSWTTEELIACVDYHAVIWTSMDRYAPMAPFNPIFCIILVRFSPLLIEPFLGSQSICTFINEGTLFNASEGSGWLSRTFYTCQHNIFSSGGNQGLFIIILFHGTTHNRAQWCSQIHIADPT